MTRIREVALITLVLALTLVLGFWSMRVIAQQQQLEPAPPVVTVPGTVPTPQTSDRPTQEAVPVKEVPSPAAPSNMPESTGWALGGALLTEIFKNTGWFTFLTPASSKRAKAIFGFLMALLTTMGIQFSVSGNIFDAGGASVTATGITLIRFKDVIWQWMFQEGWYRGLIQRASSSSAAAAPVATS